MSLLDVMSNSKNSYRAFTEAIQMHTTNMGNIETVGYKGIDYNFGTIFNQVTRGGSPADRFSGSGGTNPYQYGSGAMISNVNVDFEQGDMTQAGKLDVGIYGVGMFVVSDDNGKTFQYTRNGEFRINSEGFMVDPVGRKLFGYQMIKGTPDTSTLVPVKVDSSSADVGWHYQEKNGILIDNYTNYKYAYDEEEELPEVNQLYQLALVSFPNRSGLIQVDGTTFKQSIASGEAYNPKLSGAEYGTIYSQTREKSNVSYIAEMVDALAIQRAMSASLTAIKLANQQIQNVVQQLGS